MCFFFIQAYFVQIENSTQSKFYISLFFFLHFTPIFSSTSWSWNDKIGFFRLWSPKKNVYYLRSLAAIVLFEKKIISIFSISIISFHQIAKISLNEKKKKNSILFLFDSESRNLNENICLTHFPHYSLSPCLQFFWLRILSMREDIRSRQCNVGPNVRILFVVCSNHSECMWIQWPDG